MNKVRELISLLVEHEKKFSTSEHLVQTGIDLVVNEFKRLASNTITLEEIDARAPEEQIDEASRELRRIIESAYRDMMCRLQNGDFKDDNQV